MMNIDCAIIADCRFPYGRAASEVLQILRHLLALFSRFGLFSRVGHLPEVCTLSRPMMFQSVSIPLQSGIRFFWHLIPISSSSHLTAFLPLRERYGLTTFRQNDTTGLGSLSTPKVLNVHDAASPRLRSDLIQPCKHLRVVTFDDASNESSDVLTLPVTLALIRLMLADTFSSRDLNVNLVIEGTLSEGFRRFVTLPPYLVGYC